jgi:ribosomal protein L11 methyltransferase
MSIEQRWVEIELQAHGDQQEIMGALLLTITGCKGYTATETAVLGYLPVDERVEGTLLALKAALGRKEITIRFVAEEDWAHAWKQYFKPQHIGNNIVIKPSWEEYAAKPTDIVIDIDPGMAFGTGLHATTRLCLCELERYVTPGMHIADVGTGSGILAIAAAHLGAVKVEATDNDPLAVKIALENINLNGVGERVSAIESEVPPAGTFDIVVANILADVILGMRDLLKGAIKPGGLLIASGIINERADDVRKGLVEVGFVLQETTNEGDWVAIRAQVPK